MADAAFLAGDWGGTNLRAWVVSARGEVLRRRDFALGVNSLAPGEARRRFDGEVRPALGAERLTAILCGAIGSNVGWTVAPYVDCPASFAEVAAGLCRVEGEDPPVWIAPGIRCDGVAGAPDVLRGEETQAFGWLRLDPARAHGRRLVCHPGTHSKWLRVEAGRITRFVSAFTGELFEVLCRHSIFKTPAPYRDDPEAFEAGLAAAGDGEALTARLYAARGRVAGAGAPPDSTPSFLSGLLIGAEAASLPGLIAAEQGETIELIGAPELCARYATALGRRDWTVRIHAGDEAVLAGLKAIFAAGATA
ncbi:MAG: 2-dehydro-3-deoxygalactonokinase [Caulobacterales bacterium]